MRVQPAVELAFKRKPAAELDGFEPKGMFLRGERV
jgi:hypothetical protein